MAKTRRTAPPPDGIPVVLFDGHCRLCRAQAKNVVRLSRGKVAALPLQEHLWHYPDLTEEEAMHEMKMVDANGRIYGGAESWLKLIHYGYPVLGKVLSLYYVPGVRWIADKAYAWIAGNRYKLFGRVQSDCDDSACAIYAKVRRR